MFAWHAPALFQVPMLQREGRESCQVSSSRMAGTVCHPPHEHLLTVSSQTTPILALHTAVSTQAKYISQCIDEIKQELKQDNIAVKANAVCKLTYVSAFLLPHLPACLSSIHQTLLLCAAQGSCRVLPDGFYCKYRLGMW